MSTEMTQTIANAVLLLVVAFVGGTLGLRRFESIERSIKDLRTELKGDIAELRTELKGDIAELRTELKGDSRDQRIGLDGSIAELRTELKADIADLRTELVQMRSDLTYVALAVGARPAEGSA